MDTDREAAARMKLLNDDIEVFQELMDCNGLPLLRMKVVQGTEGALSLACVNGARPDDGRVVSLQIAATHDMGNAPSVSSPNGGLAPTGGRPAHRLLQGTPHLLALLCPT